MKNFEISRNLAQDYYYHLVVIILQAKIILFWNWRNLETIKRHRRSSSSRHFVRSLIAAMTNGFSNCSRKKNQNNGTQNGTDHRRHSDSEEDSAQDSFGNNFKSNMKIRNVFEKIIQKKFLKITVKKKLEKIWMIISLSIQNWFNMRSLKSGVFLCRIRPFLTSN